MSEKSNEIFFDKKKQWSEIKDDLLRCYLKPYMAKILAHGGPVRYVDCFAGAGRFSDGSDGSPLIAIKEINGALEFSHTFRKDVKMYFIEKTHADALSQVLGTNPLVGDVIKGSFENEIIPLAKRLQRSNIFCYIDPFGVKVLDSRLLDEFLKLDFNTVEMLINFNSFGFFRWACAHEHIQIDRETNEEFAEFNDEDASYVNTTEGSLNSILGTTEWKEIIAEYNKAKARDKNAGRNAVDAIAVLYWKLLKRKFKYVLSIKISVKHSGKAEYHMFFATQHEDGAILMGDSMGKREGKMHNIRENGQLFLFDEEEDSEGSYGVIEQVLDEMRKNRVGKIHLKQFEAIAYTYMATYIPETALKNYLKILEKEGRIQVERYPEKSPSKGKKTSFWNEDHGNKLWIIP